MSNSYADISQHLSEMYGYSLSDSELTAITDKSSRRCGYSGHAGMAESATGKSIHAGLAGCIYYKVRQDGKVVTRVLYSVIGLSLSGKKQVLGNSLWLLKEAAKAHQALKRCPKANCPADRVG